jgi:hypothetical protein
MRRQERLPGHVGPHPRPIGSRQRSAGRQAGRAVDGGNAPGDLEPKWADVAVNDLERRPESGHILVVALGEVGSFQLLLTELGQRV